MPEGPEVKIVTDWLVKTCIGAKIVDNFKFPQVNGMIIQDVHCKGKQIFFKLRSAECLYLNSRLGMTGRWSDSNVGHVRFWIKLSIPYVIYESDIPIVNFEEKIVYNTDTRNFGDIELLSSDQYLDKLKAIGPDLLSESIDPKLWYQKIKNYRIKTKLISDYLLEQKYFSGIGNYLKSDVLYLAKIRPDRMLSSLTDDEIVTLLKVSLITIRESYSAGGLTIKDFWSPEGTRGEYKRKIYNREVDDQGNRIIKEYFNSDRVTYWVPEIQK